MRNFRKLEIWKDGIQIVKDVYVLLKGFPNTEKFGLTTQLSRSVVSIPSNIAEGCSRNSQKDFSRFLQIALGSSFELETQLTISRELEYITKAQFNNILDKLHSLQRQMNSLKKYAESHIEVSNT